MTEWKWNRISALCFLSLTFPRVSSRIRYVLYFTSRSVITFTHFTQQTAVTAGPFQMDCCLFGFSFCVYLLPLFGAVLCICLYWVSSLMSNVSRSIRFLILSSFVCLTLCHHKCLCSVTQIIHQYVESNCIQNDSVQSPAWSTPMLTMHYRYLQFRFFFFLFFSSHFYIYLMVILSRVVLLLLVYVQICKANSKSLSQVYHRYCVFFHHHSSCSPARRE